jgi:FAD/FMN-containing dehydrogenase
MASYTNAWKNISFSPESVLHPKSTEELVDIVNLAKKWGRKLKPIGGGHGFNHNIKTDGLLFDIAHLNKVISVDAAAQTAEFQAGITLAQIIETLDAQGLHFPGLGSWSSQSIAGAIATSTHSSSLHAGSLSDNVLEIEAVLADGSVRRFDVDSVALRAFRASVGQLGIVTKVKAKFVPSFFLKSEVHSCSEADGFRTIVDVARANQFVNMLWLPYLGECAIRILSQVDATAPNDKAVRQTQSAIRQTRFDSTLKDVKDFLDGQEFLSNPKGLAEHYSLKFRDGFFADDGMVDKSYNIFRYDKYGEPNTNHYLRMILNSETAIDIKELEGALTKLKELIGGHADAGRYINWPRVHIRFTQGSDQTLIGLNQGRDTAYVGIYIIGNTQHHAQIQVARDIEAVLVATGGRPHWGKFRYREEDDFQGHYPLYHQFQEIRQVLDPNGLFSDGAALFKGLDYFESPPSLRMLQSLFDRDTYFPVQVL